VFWFNKYIFFLLLLVQYVYCVLDTMFSRPFLSFPRTNKLNFVASIFDYYFCNYLFRVRSKWGGTVRTKRHGTPRHPDPRVDSWRHEYCPGGVWKTAHPFSHRSVVCIIIINILYFPNGINWDFLGRFVRWLAVAWNSFFLAKWVQNAYNIVKYYMLIVA